MSSYSRLSYRESLDDLKTYLGLDFDPNTGCPLFNCSAKFSGVFDPLLTSVLQEIIRDTYFKKNLVHKNSASYAFKPSDLGPVSPYDIFSHLLSEFHKAGSFLRRIGFLFNENSDTYSIIQEVKGSLERAPTYQRARENLCFEVWRDRLAPIESTLTSKQLVKDLLSALKMLHQKEGMFPLEHRDYRNLQRNLRNLKIPVGSSDTYHEDKDLVVAIDFEVLDIIISVLWGDIDPYTEASVYGYVFIAILKTLPVEYKVLNQIYRINGSIDEGGIKYSISMLPELLSKRTAVHIVLSFVDIDRSIQNLKNINFKI